MSTGKIISIANIKAKQGKEKVLKEKLRELTEPSKHHDGCLCYDFHISKNDPCQFICYEI